MNTELATKDIQEDENDFLNAIERENYAAATVSAITDIERSLDHHIIGKGPKTKDEIKELKTRRAFHLYNLLLLRNYDPDIGISLKIVQRPNEKLHSFSQNRVIITAENPQTHSPMNFVTYLDMLARTLPPSSSSDVINLIGEPDETEDQLLDRFIQRVFEEGHAAQRAFYQAEKTGDEKTALIAANTINILLPNRLRSLRENEDVHVGFDEKNSTFYFYHDGESVRITEIPYFERTDNLIEKSGGVTMIEPV